MATTPEIKLVLETITPERALDLLTGNTENRIIRESTVQAYARDMLNNRWRDGQGEPIHYDPIAKILGNGQHRLLAIIESETTQHMPMLYAPINWRMVADQGLHRTFGDVLKITYHESNYHALASAVRYVWSYRRIGEFGATQGQIIVPPTETTKGVYLGKPTIAELEEVYLTERGLIDHLVWIGRIQHNSVPIFPSLFVAMHYIFYEIDSGDADMFAEQLTFGTNLEDGSPILALRRLMQNENRPHRAKHQAALVIKSWNAWRNGEVVKTLMWKPGGKTPEAFPVIDGSGNVRRPRRRTRKAA